MKFIKLFFRTTLFSKLKIYSISFCFILFYNSCVTKRFSVDPVFTEYKAKNYSFEGHEAKIVFPNKKSAKNYWIWRARFWGHEPQLDKALLERGFHLVYIDVSNLYGNSEAVRIWDKFYQHCIEKYGLNKKVVLEGMSRGGLIVYNWASKNTDKIFCIYADAPVCDPKSWPGGLYEGSGDPQAWQEFLLAYNLNKQTVLDYMDIPINNCISIAKSKIPVIHVYGEDDKIVPYLENTAVLAKNFHAAGGLIKLIGKTNVGHHPHSLEDPTPIVEFILSNMN